MEQKTSLKEISRLLLDPAFDRVLVACHRSPDGDAVGSSHALAYALRKMGKQARVFSPDPFDGKFSYITKAEEEIAPFSPERFVTVDVAAPSMLPGAPFLDRVDLVLDHHRISTLPGKVRWICPESASCGEIVLDKLFIEQLEKRFPDLSVTVLVRGEEVLNDATPADAKTVGLDLVANVISNGLPIAGTVYTMLPDEAKKALDQADVILAKGQGNYESLSRQGRHIYYSFLCKCELFTNRFSAPLLTGIFCEERE